jgi:hypothetical protein
LRADAMKAAVTVDAGSGVLAGVVVQALVDVDSTVRACEASALANGSGGSFFAHASVVARIRIAEPAVVASLAAQLRRALAVVVVTQVDALGFKQTRA